MSGKQYSREMVDINNEKDLLERFKQEFDIAQFNYGIILVDLYRRGKLTLQWEDKNRCVGCYFSPFSSVEFENASKLTFVIRHNDEKRTLAFFWWAVQVGVLEDYAKGKDNKTSAYSEW